MLEAMRSTSGLLYLLTMFMYILSDNAQSSTCFPLDPASAIERIKTPLRKEGKLADVVSTQEFLPANRFSSEVTLIGWITTFLLCASSKMSIAKQVTGHDLLDP